MVVRLLVNGNPAALGIGYCSGTTFQPFRSLTNPVNPVGLVSVFKVNVSTVEMHLRHSSATWHKFHLLTLVIGLNSNDDPFAYKRNTAV